MSETVEIILVGGSKDGTIAEGGNDVKAVNNIVLNDDKTGPAFIDLYMPTSVTDKEGRPIYAHIGRYDETESASYWASLPQSEKDSLKLQAIEAEQAAEKAQEDKEAEEAKNAVVENETPPEENKEQDAQSESNEGGADGEDRTDASTDGEDENATVTQEQPEVKDETKAE